MSNELDKLNEQLLAIAGCKLAIVPIDQFDFLEKNARMMRHETFKNLISNISRMGFQQLPFCWKTPDGRYKILSGNHRVKAAIEAGKTELPTLYTDTDLTPSEQTAIQLSHNSIAGEDDPVLLRELWDSLADVGLKYYAGLDDRSLAALQRVTLPPLSEIRLDYKAINFLFLPDEAARLEAMLTAAAKLVKSHKQYAGRLQDFDRLMDSMATAQAAYNVSNAATSIMLLLDVFERHQTELAEGWEMRGDDEKVSWIPLSTIFGTDRVPVGAAKVIRAAVDRMRDKGDVDGGSLWKVVENLAADYLAGV